MPPDVMARSVAASAIGQNRTLTRRQERAARLVEERGAAAPHPARRKGLLHLRRPVAAGAVPHHRRHPGVAPVGRRGGDLRPFHVGDPRPRQGAPVGRDGQRQIAPLPPHLHPLADLQASRRPHPAHAAAQPHPHLVPPRRGGVGGHPRGGQGVGEPPFFQASCASGDAFSASGRGTFAVSWSWRKSERIPQ